MNSEYYDYVSKAYLAKLDLEDFYILFLKHMRLVSNTGNFHYLFQCTRKNRCSKRF